MAKFTSHTTYFMNEGKQNLADCVEESFVRARGKGISTIVIFTTNGEGVELACSQLLPREEFSNFKVIGVSFPFGKAPAAELAIPEERQRLFDHFRIPILRAASPFDDLSAPNRPGANFVRRTLELLSGGFALCIQGVLVACDAGLITAGEHVLSLCADTAIVAKAAPSAKMFSLVVREIVCKPLIHDISKGESLPGVLNVEATLRDRSQEEPLRLVDQKSRLQE